MTKVLKANLAARYSLRAAEASRGSHMRAASFTPSDMGIQKLSTSFTLRGKSVFVRISIEPPKFLAM